MASFSFGAPAGAAASSSPFGTTSTPSSSGGLFGASTGGTSTAFGGGTSTFGGGTNAFGGGSNAFGSGGFSSSASSTPSLFNPASSTTPSTSSPSPFSFGPSTTASTSSSGLFNTSPTQNTQPGFSFSSTSAPAQGSFGFGGATGNNATPGTSFGAPLSTPAGTGFGIPSSGRAFAPADSPLENLRAIQIAYQDIQQSRFKHMFYNVVDPSQISLYVRPQHISERLWKQAEADNPDPENCVPTAVIGFKQLHERVESMQAYLSKFMKYVEDLRAALRVMENSSRTVDIKFDKCRVEHIQLQTKLLQIMRKIDVYQCLRKPTHVDETRLRNGMEKLQWLLDQPTKYKAKLHELESLQRMQAERYSYQEEAVADDLEALTAVLDSQREGLQQLTKLIQKNLRDVEIIGKGLAQREMKRRGVS